MSDTPAPAQHEDAEPASEPGEASSSARDEASASKRRRPAFRWLIDIAIVLGILVGVGLWQARNLVPPGEPAPALSLPQLDGDPVDLEALRGKAVMVQFWATWCGVCKREFGALNAVHEDATDDRVLLTVVEDHDDLDALRAFADERELDYPILLADAETLQAWNVGAFPTTYWIAPDGTVSARRVGAVTRWGMAWRLGRALR